MFKQAGRKDRDLLQNLKEMEVERPEEFLGHVANFSDELLDCNCIHSTCQLQSSIISTLSETSGIALSSPLFCRFAE